MTDILDSSPQIIKGVGKKFLEILVRYGYTTIYDLLLHFPEYYINTKNTDNILEEGTAKVYLVKISRSNLYRNYRRKLSIINITGFIGDTPVDLILFNKPYLIKQIKSSDTLKIYGKSEVRGMQTRIENPKILKDEDGIIPVYKNIGSIPGGTLKNIIENIFSLNEIQGDILPEHLVNELKFEPFLESLVNIHSPASSDIDLKKLKERFIYTEFLFFQLEISYIRKCSGKIKRERQYSISSPEKLISDHIRFKLTADQKRSVKDIISDLKGEFTMQRILLGDVGSGKTVISFIFLLFATMNNHQGAFLAPTEVLINQHFENASRFFKGIRIAVLTGSTPLSQKRSIIKELMNGDISIIFGTHSLINEKIVFKDLSAIVIDEQHRFGVSQRAALFYKGEKADLMVTTATPIPRTLLLSLYKDLDVSEIRSMPEGRLPVDTMILKQSIRERFYSEIRESVIQGEKIFIVLPLISPSVRFSDFRSLESELPFFKKIFKGIPFGVVSGRVSQEERISIFSKFSDGKIKILVSTTIIEVGIDIKDATIIIIEDADKFGLSQLHQLRGRVGRGNKKSYCYLFPSGKITKAGKERLRIIKETSDGFSIAEKDLGMRGGGNIIGTEQSGYLDFHISDIKEYPEIYFKAGKDAITLIKNKSLRNSHIKKKLKSLDDKLEKISFS